MKTRLYKQNDGYTVIEVLVAALIFMVGFSLLISLLNNSLVKFSTKEILHANNLAQEIMVKTVVEKDTTEFDSLLSRSNLTYKVQKKVEIKDNLAGIIISVSRENTNKEIIQLYNAFLLPEE